jgi:DNA-binding MarR family transcriptional regulator
MTTIRRKNALEGIDRAMVRIRRSQTRRTIGRQMERELGTRLDPSASFVVDALDELQSISDEEHSVGAVAEQLGIDPSRASRMVASAIREGYVRRTAAQMDGRRTCLLLTVAGRKLLQTARSFRTEVFSQRMTTWSDGECFEFARLLKKFTEPPATMSSSATKKQT